MPKMKELIEKRYVSEEVLLKAARGALTLPKAEILEILIHLTHDAVVGEQAKQTLQKWGADEIITAIADPYTSKETLQWAVGPENPISGQTLYGLAKRSGNRKSVEKLLSVCPGPVIKDILNIQEVHASVPLLQRLLSNPNLKQEQAALLQKRIGELQAQAKLVAPPTPPAVTAPPIEPAKATESAAVAKPDPDKTNTPAATQAAAAETKKEETKEATPVQKPAAAVAPVTPEDKEIEEQSAAWLAQHAAEIAAEEGAEVTRPVEAEVDVEQIAEAVEGGPAPKERVSTVQKLLRMPVSLRIQQALKGNREERSILIHDTSRLVCLAVLASPKLASTEAEAYASLKNVREEVLRELVRNRKFRKNYVVIKNLCNNPKNPLDTTLALLNDLQPYDLRAVGMNKNVPDTIRKIAMKKFQDKVSGHK